MGAGLFFLTYALFEVPSNLILHWVGARVWMCRIMVSWGLVSIATLFVSGPRSFYVLRLLLGAAEAGFFPGVILYLSYWFPNRMRGQILGLFYFGAPLAFIVGGPLSGLLLELPARTGLQGWQWMFLSEGLEHCHSCYRVPKRVLNQACAFSGVSCGNSWERAWSRASLVRALAERSSVLSLDQAFSMGFRSGE